MVNDRLNILSENETGPGGVIAAALSASFDELVCVDLKDGSYRICAGGNDLPGQFAEKEGSDFFAACRELIDRFVCEDDAAGIRRFMTREHLLGILSTERFARISVRMMLGESISWRRIRCFYCDEKKELLLLTVENTDREPHYEVFTSLTSNYTCVFSVNTLTGEITDHMRRPGPDGQEKETEAFFSLTTLSERIELVSEKWVCPADREQFFEQMKLTNLLQQLQDKPVYSVNYRVIQDGEYHFYKFKIVREKNLPCLIIGIRNRDQDEYQDLLRKRELMDAKARTEMIVEQQTEELRAKNISLRKMNEGIVELLGSVVEGRDQNSGEHIRRIKGFTYILARQVMEDLPEYGLTEKTVNLIVYASALHDLGKVAIPDRILLKPGPLNNEEFEVMKTHCERGCDILRSMVGYWSQEYLDVDMDICMYHHEKWDGRGYPRGLKGDEIPISAQIVSIADIYDALTSSRCYKKALPFRTVTNMILSGECGAFSEKLLECFRKCSSFFEKHASDPTSMIQVSISAEETVAEVTAYDNALEELSVHRPGTPVETVSGGTVYRRTGCFEGMRFLLVDDSELAIAVSREVLDSEGAVTETVTNGAEALYRIKTNGHHYDVILMDINMPGMNGAHTTELIRATEKGRLERIPIIAMTSDGSDDDIRAILRAGANDCIGKPMSANELSKALLTCMRERSVRAEKKLENTIRIAETDSLTHVKSITAYTDKMTELSGRIGSGEKVKYAIVMCDLNDLKKENDTFGHDSGDRYIINCCRILCSVFCHSPVYRIGGDEFVAVLQGQDYKDAAGLMAELKNRAAAARKLPDTASGKTFFSSGIAFYDSNRDYFVSDTVKRADQEMYAEKRQAKTAPADRDG